MDDTYRLWFLVVVTLVMAACGGSGLEATSEEPQAMTVVTIAVSDTSIADSAPIMAPGAAGSYRQRYLSNVAPLIVHCMNDLGWEATYDRRHGAVLPEVPASQVMERDQSMAFCVAGTRTNRGIHAD